MQNYVNFSVEKAMELLAIPSPTGYTHEAEEYLLREFSALGFEAKRTTKGGILVDLGGEDSQNALLLEAHTDTLGGMVAEIKGNGRLRIVNVGGLNANNVEAENCLVMTKFNGTYEGTLQLCNASLHVNGDYGSTTRKFDVMEVLLDEIVNSAEEVRALGIEVGDFVCFDPRSKVTDSGYIKSRFLDDKLSVGILFGLAKYIAEEKPQLSRRIYLHITVYEEVGHGGRPPSPQVLRKPFPWIWAVWVRVCSAPSGRSPSAPRTPAVPTATPWSRSSLPPPRQRVRITLWIFIPTTAPMWKPPCAQAMTSATGLSVPVSMPPMATSAVTRTAF